MPFPLRRPTWARFLVPAALVLTAAALLQATHRLESQVRSPYPLSRALAFHPAMRLMPAFGGAGSDPLDSVVLSQVPVESSLGRGETLSRVLRRLGLSPSEAFAAARAMAAHVDMTGLKAGERYVAYVDLESRLLSFSLAVTGRGQVVLERDGEGWTSRWRPYVRQVQTRLVNGSLQGFLESSIRSAGGEPRVAYEMAEVLQWDLDFNRDLRRGDSFRVLYGEEWLDGEMHDIEEILALSYVNQGQRLEAYRYGRAGHYDEHGRPLRKQFLRSPLRYSRVTSRFSQRRFHPVLKTYRPHYGVDYGAPRGTAVRVTARGVVSFAAWDRGGGKTVKVRHPNGYLTAYLHLSRYAKGIRRGSRVEQGEVVGYVGSTGLATAAHLDYRVQRDGRWVNPLALQNQPAEPIPDGEMGSFLAVRDDLRARLGWHDDA